MNIPNMKDCRIVDDEIYSIETYSDLISINFQDNDFTITFDDIKLTKEEIMKMLKEHYPEKLL